VAKLPAHRPSRRDKIVEAAVVTFAGRGFVDTSIADVAEAAGVAPAAVYYHFAGKEDLYGTAVGLVLDDIDRVVAAVRADDAPAGQDTLAQVIDAVWDWVDEHPERAQLVYLHTPAATRQAADRRQDFDDLHVRRAFSYAGSTD
jgi:AcrR family transcriptional regulator